MNANVPLTLDQDIYSIWVHRMEQFTMGQHPACTPFVEQLVNYCVAENQAWYFENLESAADCAPQAVWCGSAVGLLDFGDPKDQEASWLDHPNRPKGFIVLCGICQPAWAAKEVFLTHHGHGCFDRDCKRCGN